MPFVNIEHDAGHTTVVNTEQITYLRTDMYGTAIHFTSGEHVLCPMEMESLVALLFGENMPESLLVAAT